MLLSVLPLIAVGCAGQPVQMDMVARNVPPEQALVLPPAAGPGILSVIERRYDNAVEQDILLHTSARTPGQNAFKVQLFGTASPFKLSDNKLTSRPVTEAGIASEMRRSLPGIRMTRSSFYVQNGYGPFGYAFGRGAGNDLCMYAWQQIRSPSGTISPFANYGSIQVRLRLCQADATEQRLLAVMYNYTISGAVDAGGWNPYGDPKPVSATLGGVGAPVYPRPAAGEPIVPVLPRQTTLIRTGSASAPAIQSGRTIAPATAVPSVAARPAARAPTIPRTPDVSRTPLIPSPSGISETNKVTIPSPSCTDMTSGAANACR